MINSTPAQFATETRSQRRWQFTLGSLLLLVVAAAGVFAWISSALKPHDQAFIALGKDALIINGRRLSTSKRDASLIELAREMQAHGVRPEEATMHLQVADDVPFRQLKRLIEACVELQLHRFTLEVEPDERVSFEIYPDSFFTDYVGLAVLEVKLRSDADGKLIETAIGNVPIALSQMRQELIALPAAADDPFYTDGYCIEFHPDEQLRCRHLKDAWAHAAWHDDDSGVRHRFPFKFRPFRQELERKEILESISDWEPQVIDLEAESANRRK